MSHKSTRKIENAGEDIILQNAWWKGKTKGRENRKREEGEDGRQGEKRNFFFPQELVLLNYNPLAPSGGQDHE